MAGIVVGQVDGNLYQRLLVQDPVVGNFFLFLPFAAAPGLSTPETVRDGRCRPLNRPRFIFSFLGWAGIDGCTGNGTIVLRWRKPVRTALHGGQLDRYLLPQALLQGTIDLSCDRLVVGLDL
jgi:hypothetical protein